MIYDNIKARRKALGMTQTDLANKLGYYDKSMISRIEKGKINLPYTRIILFAEALDVSVEELIR